MAATMNDLSSILLPAASPQPSQTHDDFLYSILSEAVSIADQIVLDCRLLDDSSHSSGESSDAEKKQ